MSASIRTARPVTIARWLVVASFLAMMFSPPLTNLIQALLIALFVGSPDLRGRLREALRQPLVRGALAFFAVLMIGATYSHAGSAGGWGMVWGWRKLLMLPLAAALFEDPLWKNRLLKVLAGAAGLLALGSILMVAADLNPPAFLPGRGPGVLVRNHATQGIIFSVAAISAAAIVVFGIERRKALRLSWAAAVVALVSSVTLVTTGRTGYIAILIGATSLALGWSVARRLPAWKAVATVATTFALLATLIAFSPVAQQRIDQARAEIQTYTEATTATSMGVRMYFWQNAIALIKERPLLGWGTGGFESAYSQLVAGRPGNAGLGTSDPHNQFLKITAEHGLVGLAVFVGFLLMAVRQKVSIEYRTIGLSVLAVWCTTSMANSHFSTYAEGTFIYLWLGAMLAFKPAGGLTPGRST